MRQNLPITNTEYHLRDDSVITSQTDVNGTITFVNDDFIEASGYSEDELMSKPHNILRHPEMPPEAFRDLWLTLKAGKPWTGAVKNRRKNGDYYWVLANATPMWENGAVVGYMSIRTKLPVEIRQKAEDFYRELRDKKKLRYTLSAGLVRRKAFADRFGLFTRTLNARFWTLGAITGALLAACVAIETYAVFSAHTETESVYGRLQDVVKTERAVETNLTRTIEEIQAIQSPYVSAAEMEQIKERAIHTFATAYEQWVKLPATKSPRAEKRRKAQNDLKTTIEALVKSQKDAKTRQLDSVVLQSQIPVLLSIAHTARENLDSILDETRGAAIHASTTYQNASILVVLLLALGILFNGLFLRASCKAVVGPLSSLKSMMENVARGQYNTYVEIPRDDEVGTVLRHMQATQAKLGFDTRVRRQAEIKREKDENEARIAKEKAIEDERVLVTNSIGVALKALADRNMSYRITEKLPDAYLGLGADFNNAMNELEAAIRSAIAISNSVLLGATEISKASDDLARQTEQQAASLEETSASLTEITDSVKRTADDVQQVTASATATKKDTENGERIVREAIEAMNKMKICSTEIGQFVNVIDDIAFQTNLLALNAGVEAARAGDAGKGFAVVANEVRALALRSAESAREIKAQIANVASRVAEGVEMVAETGKALSRIVGQVAEIETVVSSISSSAQEQFTSVREIKIAVAQMDQMTQRNAAMAEQTTAASKSLYVEANELDTQMKLFDVRDEEDEDTLRTQLRSVAPHVFKPSQTRAAVARGTRDKTTEPAHNDRPHAPVLETASSQGFKRAVNADHDWDEF